MDAKLYKAATSGDLSFLGEIRDLKLELGQVTPQNNTVLHVALRFQQLEFFRRALDLYPALLNISNLNKESPLHMAAEMGWIEVTETLATKARAVRTDIESGEVNQLQGLLRMKNNFGDTALHVAMTKRHFEVAKLLIKADAGLLDLVNNANASPLFQAANSCLSVSDSLSIVRFILETSPAANFFGPNGLTALHAAVIHKCHDITNELVEKCPNMIKEADEFGWTPLHYAAYNGNLKAAERFLEKNSSIAYSTGMHGESAFHIAAFQGHRKVMEKVLECCPDIFESTDERGRNALHAAVIGDKKDVVNYILETPELASIINERDKEGNSALHLVVLYRRREILVLLSEDKRVVKTSLNINSLTPRGIFESRPHSDGFTTEKFRYFLGETTGCLKEQQNIQKLVNDTLFERTPTEEESSQRELKTNPEDMKSVLEVNMVVSTLIATVSFAAAFQVPGGYRSEGIANLVDKPSFQAFVVFNSFAFFFSTGAVLIHLATSREGNFTRFRYNRFAFALTICALYAMVLAFASGKYAILSESFALALTPCAMAVGFPIVHRIARIIDPAAPQKILYASKMSRSFRTILYRHRLI